ncbi:hypothetical protein [Novosphingobium sp. CF614]|nr:hypothetical protein [Novosphingobium sp. CF614]
MASDSVRDTPSFLWIASAISALVNVSVERIKPAFPFVRQP